MGALRSVIDEVTSTDLLDLTDSELSDEASELCRAIDLLTHRLAAVTFQVGLRGIQQVAGLLNVTRWLAVVGDMDNASAGRFVKLGRTLFDHPVIGSQAASGELSAGRIRILARAASAHQELYREHEELLVGFAHDMDLKDFRRAVEYWSSCADAVTAEKARQDRRDSQYLHASQLPDGMVKFDGLFEKEAGEAIWAALNAAMTPQAREHGADGDLRPAPQRRADGMEHICRTFLDTFPGVVGGHRPHVSLIVDLKTLQGGLGMVCELANTGSITPQAARRILCDAEVSRFVVAGDSAPLEMGRATRTATPAQRRALAIRDGGCVWRDCDRPPEWCDVHHLIHWLIGGLTDVDNMVLLCRRHHDLVHRLEEADMPVPTLRGRDYPDFATRDRDQPDSPDPP